MPQYTLTLAVAYEATFQSLGGIEAVAKLLARDERVQSFTLDKEGRTIGRLMTKDVREEQARELSNKLILDFGLIVRGNE